MKVKSFLNVCLNDVEIIENEDHKFYEHNVSYKFDHVESYGGFTDYPSKSCLPKRILDADIKFVSVNSANGRISIDLK